jgi:hypothetical protein
MKRILIAVTILAALALWLARPTKATPAVELQTLIATFAVGVGDVDVAEYPLNRDKLLRAFCATKDLIRCWTRKRRRWWT